MSEATKTDIYGPGEGFLDVLARVWRNHKAGNVTRAEFDFVKSRLLAAPRLAPPPAPLVVTTAGADTTTPERAGAFAGMVILGVGLGIFALPMLILGFLALFLFITVANSVAFLVKPAAVAAGVIYAARRARRAWWERKKNDQIAADTYRDRDWAVHRVSELVFHGTDDAELNIPGPLKGAAIAFTPITFAIESRRNVLARLPRSEVVSIVLTPTASRLRFTSRDDETSFEITTRSHGVLRFSRRGLPGVLLAQQLRRHYTGVTPHATTHVSGRERVLVAYLESEGALTGTEVAQVNQILGTRLYEAPRSNIPAPAQPRPPVPAPPVPAPQARSAMSGRTAMVAIVLGVTLGFGVCIKSGTNTTGNINFNKPTSQRRSEPTQTRPPTETPPLPYPVAARAALERTSTAALMLQSYQRPINAETLRGAAPDLAVAYFADAELPHLPGYAGQRRISFHVEGTRMTMIAFETELQCVAQSIDLETGTKHFGYVQVTPNLSCPRPGTLDPVTLSPRPG